MTTTVIVHGSKTYDEIGGVFYVDELPINVAQIADAIRANPSYDELENTMVCLASCWSGSNGTAQELTNQLGRPVYAPSVPVAWDQGINGWVLTTHDGFGEAHMFDLSGYTVDWHTFHPN